MIAVCYALSLLLQLTSRATRASLDDAINQLSEHQRLELIEVLLEEEKALKQQHNEAAATDTEAAMTSSTDEHVEREQPEDGDDDALLPYSEYLGSHSSIVMFGDG